MIDIKKKFFLKLLDKNNVKENKKERKQVNSTGDLTYDSHIQ